MGRAKQGKTTAWGFPRVQSPMLLPLVPSMIMPVFTDILLHLSSDSHVFKGLFPHRLHSMEHFGATSLDFTCELKNNRKERHFYLKRFWKV